MTLVISKFCSVFILLTLALAALPTNADPVYPDNFVLNGDFEIHRPAAPFGDEVCEAFGDDVWLPPPPAPPVMVLGCDLDRARAGFWSHHTDTHFGDFTGADSIQARIGGSASHNLWQTYNSFHQAYSARMDAYTFEVKWSSLGQEGTWQVPNNAAIRVSLTTTPVENANPWVGLFIECTLIWSGSDINANIDANGLVTLDPLAARFVSGYSDCDDAAALWNDEATTDDARRDQLGRLRIIQNSFWHFNAGGNVVIIDNIATRGSTLAAEELAGGNHNHA